MHIQVLFILLYLYPCVFSSFVEGPDEYANVPELVVILINMPNMFL